jgi:septum formation protein
MQLILASSSPRRAELLRSAGFGFEIVPAQVNEDLLPGESAPAYVSRLAEAKAGAVSTRVEPASLILAADTTVVINNRILGKPADSQDAASMLSALSGNWHEVLTGIAIFAADTRRLIVESTRVRFATLTLDEIRWYVSTGEPLDKAGAYAVQGLGARFVERIEGSYSNVVGLPLERVYQLFKELGVAGLAG